MCCDKNELLKVAINAANEAPSYDSLSEVSAPPPETKSPTAPESNPAVPPSASNMPDFSPPPRRQLEKSRDQVFEEKVWVSAKAQMPEQAILPPLSSKPTRVFAGSLESAVVTENGLALLSFFFLN